MKLRWSHVLITMAMVLAFTCALMAQEAAKTEAPKHQFVGEKGCKMCHKKDGIDSSWAATIHATAYRQIG